VTTPVKEILLRVIEGEELEGIRLEKAREFLREFITEGSLTEDDLQQLKADGVFR